jgi:hypothetical protein
MTHLEPNVVLSTSYPRTINSFLFYYKDILAPDLEYRKAIGMINSSGFPVQID